MDYRECMTCKQCSVFVKASQYSEKHICGQESEFRKGFLAGAEQMRERAAKLSADCNIAHSCEGAFKAQFIRALPLESPEEKGTKS